MKISSLYSLPIIALTLAFAACDDENTSEIGGSLIGDNAEIVIDSAFTLTGNTVRVEAINPKTTSQLLGRINVKGYGTLSSDVVTQFLPSTVLDTANFTVENIDSLFLTLAYTAGNFMGDSVAPLGLDVYPLTRMLPDDVNSSFNPQGYYSSNLMGQTVYNASTLDKVVDAALSYRMVSVKLPLDLGRHIFNSFTSNPDNFANGQVFSQNVFPGFYLKSTFGSGRITTFESTGIVFYMRKIVEGTEKNDTIDAVQQYMLVTPEVISNNDLHYTMDADLRSRLANGENVLAAPIATEMELTFPLPDIIRSYNAHGGKQAVLNGLALNIPVDTIEGSADLDVPPYVLMVLKKDREEFFEKNKLPDNKTSFYAEYNESTGGYNFGALKDYLMDMLDKESVTDDDYTFSLIPVQINFEMTTSSGYYSRPQYVATDVRDRKSVV